MTKRVNPELLHNKHWDISEEELRDLDTLPRIQIALNWIKDIKPKKVLDIGCGPGHLARLIKKNLPFTEIHGFDFSKVAIEKASQSLDQSWKLNIDLEDIPVESSHYDAIICLEILEHIYDVSHVLREIHRLLKHSGKALISVPNLAYWRYRLQLLIGVLPQPEIFNPQHIHVFTLANLRERLLESNLRIEHYWGYGQRLSALATRFPSIFSSTLFVESAILRK